MSLEHGDVLVTFTVKGNVQLGSASTAHIRTGSLLGQRILTLESAGNSTLRPMTVIPVSRTSSPYSLSEAVENLTSDVEGTDTGALNQSLDTLSTTLNEIAPQLGPAFDGVTRLSQTLNSRNKSLGELLKGAGDVTGILSQRSQQLNTLILNANDLVSMLVARRQAIVRLLESTSAVAKQLTGLVHDNEIEAGAVAREGEQSAGGTAKEPGQPRQSHSWAGEVLDHVGRNRVQRVLLQPFIPNIFFLRFFQWPFDYSFGFRAYGRPGSPPDNAGPRAFLPFPSTTSREGRADDAASTMPRSS